MEMWDWAIVAALCLLSSAVALVLLRPVRHRSAFGLLSSNVRNDPVFLFDGVDLSDRSENIPCGFADVTGWNALRERLQHDFPAFPETPGIVRAQGRIVVPAIDNAIRSRILCEWIDGIVRVQICDGGVDAAPQVAEAADPMRLAMDSAPYPVWLLDGHGKVRWCNAAYVALVRRVRGADTDLTAPFFPEGDADCLPGKRTRVAVTDEDSGRKLWFDLSQAQTDAGMLFYAVDINAVVDAEVAQRKFVQTLAKTFAQLSIGLAIFDRNRQLALFNPALVDLTTLPADFLSCRPSLSSFFDRLRNQNMMPEPKTTAVGGNR